MIYPLNDYVIIEMKKEEKVTDSGIYIPKETRNEPNCAVVVACEIPGLDLVGKKVWFKKWSDQELSETKELRSVHKDDLLGIDLSER